MAGGKTLMTEEEARSAMMEMQNQLRQQAQEKAKVQGEANQKEGDTFLAANKSKEGVVTLPSGLQYKILKAGTGPKPTATDKVVCNYQGTLINGKEFDASARHGGLQLMPVGSKWQLFVPPSLAYGERGAGGDIGPNETLIFEVELVSIAPKDSEKKPEEKK
jgi:FKBP-type peptidyl-prolyl cis-trans isomerase